MALAIDASSPAVATQTNGATATVASASFTPPSGSLLLIQWCGNSTSLPSAPTITDNLGAHLTYTSRGWQSRADSPTKDGQAAQWTAPVATGAAMTVTVTNGASSGFREAALRITVLTGQDASPIGTNGKGGSASSGALAQSVAGTADGSQAFGAATDWDALGSMTAGTGCALNPAGATGTPGGAVSYGFVKRSTADGTNGGSTTLNLTYAGTSTNIAFVYIEIKPAATGTNANAENAAGTAAADNAVVSIGAQSESSAGTGAADNAAASLRTGAENAAGTGAADNATITASGNAAAENATGTGAADSAAALIVALDGGAAGTGAANDGAAAVRCFAECATGTGAADNPSVDSGSNNAVPAECATGTGASDNATTTVTFSAGNATGTGTAPDPTGALACGTDVATGSGAASDPTVTTTTQASAGNATGTGAADNAAAGAGAQAGVAAGTGSAVDATVTSASTATAPAECAGGAAAAHDAAWSVLGSTYALASVAAGTGAALDALATPGRPGTYTAGGRAATQATGARAATYAVGQRSASYAAGGRP